nr:hypothetical protein BaRGS_034102 [Batillaria attramentaria]
MMSLSLMMFFGITVNYSYLIYVTNYVAQAIYKGDPYGDPGSVDYANYVDGGRMGSLGMLVLYISYFTFTLFHGKVLDKIGMKTEFVVVSAGCGVTLLTLALTDSLVAFFVSSIIMAVYRTIIYTTPFVLANHSLLQQQIKDSETDQPKPDNSSAGSAMAWLVTMIPAAYFVISLAMGPLIGVTGSPSPPIFAAGGAAILAALQALKRKKRYEKQLQQIDGTLSTIEFQREALENASTNTEVLKVMGVAAKALKETHNNLDVDKVHDLMDEVAEQQEIANEIGEAISNPVGFGQDVDDDELLAELEEMEEEELNKQLLDVGGAVTDELPSVPTAEPSQPTPKVAQREDDDEMKELAAWAS